MKLNALSMPIECPFCHRIPELVKTPLWRGSHGYYGNYEYSVSCMNKRCAIKPHTKAYDDIYDMDENDCLQKAIDDWNKR